MKDLCQGMRANILRENPQAFFFPSGYQYLNFTLLNLNIAGTLNRSRMVIQKKENFKDKYSSMNEPMN
jgi:hypothetical protein